ncbi:GDSL-type esterase/lipase family protein [Actinoplanes sp. NPDC026670]|uniref:GDSL-type esterase/lipase family protein n=1 Tax=Actinoplanes sp. NPDC026670 TaxID=3154700 RepID=UPI0033D6FA71
MPIASDLIRGAAETETTARGLRPHRLPAWVREQFPDGQLLSMESQPSGVRVSFRTAATRFELVTHPTRIAYVGAERPRGRVDVFVDGELVLRDELTGGDRIEVDLATGSTTLHAGPPHSTVVSGLPAASPLSGSPVATPESGLPGGSLVSGLPVATPVSGLPGGSLVSGSPAASRRVEIWLPHNESLELVDLHADAPIEADDRVRPVWVHHGSSISHGSNAVAPSEIWPAVAARRAGVELRNLGLGGSALVDQFLARVIRDAPADLISVKLGINVVNLDGMRVRTFVPAVHGFLDTIRDGHPDVPLILISPLFCGIHEETPGPGAIDPASIGTGQVRFTATGTPGDVAFGRLTLQVIRRELQSLAERRAADKNLHFLDGLSLYGPEDAADLPLPDALHPSAEAHQLIGTRFADYAFSGSGPFGG